MPIDVPDWTITAQQQLPSATYQQAAVATAGTNTQTCTFGTALAAGDLVLIAAMLATGALSAWTVTTPTEIDVIAEMQLYGYVAAGGETSIAATNSTTTDWCMVAVVYRGGSLGSIATATATGILTADAGGIPWWGVAIIGQGASTVPPAATIPFGYTQRATQVTTTAAYYKVTIADQEYDTFPRASVYVTSTSLVAAALLMV